MARYGKRDFSARGWSHRLRNVITSARKYVRSWNEMMRAGTACDHADWHGGGAPRDLVERYGKCFSREGKLFEAFACAWRAWRKYTDSAVKYENEGKWPVMDDAFTMVFHRDEIV